MKFVITSVHFHDSDGNVSIYEEQLKAAGIEITGTGKVDFNDCPIYTIELNSLEELAELKKAVDLDLYIKDTELAVTLTGEDANEEYASLPQDAIIIVDDYLY